MPPEVLSILVEVDPITGKISEQYPDAYPKDYPERVEKFCRNYIWRKITGDITVEFLEAAVDRMFNADEVTSVVDVERLKAPQASDSQSFPYAIKNRRTARTSLDSKKKVRRPCEVSEFLPFPY